MWFSLHVTHLLAWLVMLGHFGNEIVYRQSHPLHVSNNVVDTGFAVVELFTSEGCSSCPPADALLQEITDQAMEEHTRVYTLSYHVDYWNYLGWKDPFSKPAFSDRQREYAKALKASVYTPMMVVNGKVSFVGSRRSEAEEEIRHALYQEPSVEVLFNMEVEKTDAVLTAKIQLAGSVRKNTELVVALVTNVHAVQVTMGENRGRTLDHVHIVHRMESLAAKPGDTMVTLPVVENFVSGETKLIAFLQDRESREILAAGASPYLD